MTILVARTGIAEDGILTHLSADGDLSLAGVGAAAVSGNAAEDLRFMPGRTGQAVKMPPGTTLAIPVTGLNPQAGTLMFWFRPDWSDPSYQHAMLAELLAGDAWQLR